MVAWRARSGPPSTVTTRRPSRGLADRPPVAGLGDRGVHEQADAGPQKPDARRPRSRRSRSSPSATTMNRTRTIARPMRTSSALARARDGTPRGLEPQQHGLGRDDPVGPATGHTVGPRPFTSTRSSPRTRPPGTGWRSSPPWRRRGSRRLEPGELDELVRLYQQVSGHLARARAAYDDPGLQARLNRVVAEANAAIYGGRPRTGASLRRFFGETFPAAMWATRRFLLVAAACLFVPADRRRRVAAGVAGGARCRHLARPPGAHPRVGVRRLLLAGAGRAVLDAGADEQHPRARSSPSPSGACCASPASPSSPTTG